MVAEVPPAQYLSTPPAWSLARVPGLEQGQTPLRVERLGGGTVNAVFRVDSEAGRFVLRLNGPAWSRPGVSRSRELTLHRSAADGGVAPAILAASPQTQGLLITQFREGRSWRAQDYAHAGALRRLGERLYVLHRLPVPDMAPFDPWQVAQSYLQLLDPEVQVQVQRPMLRLRRLCQGLEPDRATSIVHGDLWEGNVLLEGERLWLLDWEYAQRSEPLMDIACVLAYYPQTARLRGDFLAAAGIVAVPEEPALSERVDIYRTLSWLWHLARGERADPP